MARRFLYALPHFLSCFLNSVTVGKGGESAVKGEKTANVIPLGERFHVFYKKAAFFLPLEKEKGNTHTKRAHPRMQA